MDTGRIDHTARGAEAQCAPAGLSHAGSLTGASEGTHPGPRKLLPARTPIHPRPGAWGACDCCRAQQACPGQPGPRLNGALCGQQSHLSPPPVPLLSWGHSVAFIPAWPKALSWEGVSQWGGWAVGDQVVQSNQGAFLANAPSHGAWVLKKPQPWPKGPVEAWMLAGEPKASKAPAPKGF